MAAQATNTSGIPAYSTKWDSIATVTVGERDSIKVFRVHCDLLSTYSSYFNGLLNSTFKEGNTKEVDLSDINATAFEAFTTWLYYGKLYEPRVHRASCPTTPSNGIARTSALINWSLVSTWTLGDRIGAPKFQNAALVILHRSVLECRKIHSSMVVQIYGNTVAGSPLRAFIVEAYARIGRKISTFLDIKDRDFLTDLCDRLLELTQEHPLLKPRKQFWKDLGLCSYHIHEHIDCKGRKMVKKGAADQGGAKGRVKKENEDDDSSGSSSRD